MLVNRKGERLFNTYDLSAVLDDQLSKAKKDIELDLRNRHDYDQDNYLALQVDKYKIEPIDIDEKAIGVEVLHEMIPAEYFPSGFFVRDGKEYEKDVYRFHLKYSGDKVLFRCVPSTRLLWTEEVEINDNEIIFDVINYSDDVDRIKTERDKVKDYIISQSRNVNNQVVQYNDNLSKEIEQIVVGTVGKLSKEAKILAELGNPVPGKNDDVEIIDEDLKLSSTKKYDVFICHASEDKLYVKNLADELKKAGFEVWYDDFQLGWGDDLKPAIDNGLVNSEFGVVVLSKAFLAKKKWTEYELNGLFAKEKLGKKVILPLWYEVTRDEIAEYSPTLADRIAKMSSSLEDIIEELRRIKNS